MDWSFSIDDALVLGYRNALYHIDLPGGRGTFRVGERCTPDNPIDHSRVTVITACNPYGAVLSDKANNARHQLLEQEVAHRRWSASPAVGQDPNGRWPAEKGLAIVSATADLEDLMMLLFGQHAVLVLTANEPATLRWHPASNLGAREAPTALRRCISTLKEETNAGRPSPALNLHAQQWHQPGWLAT